ncbi:MAG TPA: hypothetical protein DCY79_09640 [Planctomycetaceae bacterium]|nr:hypothetical protein [Blastopirellula sp.]HAY80051.1 hypothetical protein [Planctomycetaceae bacterium]
MAKKSWHLNRRDLLKGTGIALALPSLNAMRPSSTRANAAAQATPKRMMIGYIAYGTYMPDGPAGLPKQDNSDQPHHDWSWWPCKDAGELTFNKSSEPFRELKDYVTYLRGLDHQGGWKMGGHSSGDVFATGADMTEHEKTNNISIDQVAANTHGHKTRYRSLVLGTEGGTGSYGSSKTLSHRGPGRPIPSMHKPQEIFNRLFNPYAGKGVDQVRAGLKRNASILDLMLDHSKSFHSRLGSEDQKKMDEYLESIRAIEQRVERTSQWTHEPLPEVDTKGLNLDVAHKEPQEYIRCMYDLVYLAFVTDSTRYATLMLESEQSSTSEMWNYATYVLGYKGATHDIAHKRPADYSGQWDRWRAEQHAYFLKRLRDTTEGDGNMLDHTVVLWGSAHPHASHSTRNYPIHLAGGNQLGFQHGRLHDFRDANKVPLANLFVSMLNAVDVPVDRFADSTGNMSQLLRS